METCGECSGEFRSVQGLRGHQLSKHPAENVNGANTPGQSSPALLSVGQVEDVVAEQLGGLLDGLVDRVSGTARDLVRQEIEAAFKARDAELVEIRRRLKSLESHRSELAAFAHFVKDEMLPATQRQLNGKENKPQQIVIAQDKASMPLPWEPAEQCGHDAPRGRLTCDSLLCIAGRLEIQGRGQ